MRPYEILLVQSVRILLFGVTIDENVGTPVAVRIHNTTETINSIKLLLIQLQGKFDICIAITHWTLSEDVLLSESISSIDLILGGHEHENIYITRQSQASVETSIHHTIISKSDSNVATVWIHRLSFDLINSKLYPIQSHLTYVNDLIPLDLYVESIVSKWFKRAELSFAKNGFILNKHVIQLPPNIILDARAITLHSGQSQFATLVMKSFIYIQHKYHKHYDLTISLLNVGSVRIDDVLTGSITEYDCIRCLPYENYIITLELSGQTLVDILNERLKLHTSDGLYTAYEGIEYNSYNNEYKCISNNKILNNDYITKYKIVTIDYFYVASNMNKMKSVKLIQTIKPSIIMAKALIEYLPIIYNH